MSVLIKPNRLVLGNGDLFLAPTVAQLPSISTYKTARANGTLNTIPGNVGAIKGTVNIQLARDILPFELGIPQEIADQTCIREGCHLKCMLAELSLTNLQAQLGLPGANYSTTTAGSTLVTSEVVTLHVDTVNAQPLESPIANAPILWTTSTPAAAANPVVKDATDTITYTRYVDYDFVEVLNTIHPVHGGALFTDGTVVHVTYYYNKSNTETLTGGGDASVLQTAVRFFHPYKDGRANEFTILKANPAGTVTTPYEEIAYSNSEFELKGIADFTQPSGQHLWRYTIET